MKKHLLPLLCVLVLALSVSLAGAEAVDDSAQPALFFHWPLTDGDLPFPTVVEEEDQVVFQNLSWLSDLGVQPEAMGAVYAYDFRGFWYKAGDVQDHGDWIVVKMSPKELIAGQLANSQLPIMRGLELELPGNERFDSIVFEFDATANTVEKALSFILLEDGRRRASWNAEGARLEQWKYWAIIADYDPDGWLRYAQIYPTEEPGYPEFCYRRNETGYDFWWFYDENHGFDQRRAYDGGWYNPNTGEAIPGPEGVSGTPELPFRLIGLEEVPFVLKSW